MDYRKEFVVENLCPHAQASARMERHLLRRMSSEMAHCFRSRHPNGTEAIEG